MTEITSVDAWEVLDSRGNPTVRAAVETDAGRGVFTVPSGASTGAHEAVERRDGDDRFDGKGVRKAARAVREELASALVGREVTDQSGIDAEMVDVDGTDDLSRLGANAVLAASGAVARAASVAREKPLYEYLAPDGGPGKIPLPTVNVLSGGLHAKGSVEIQDFLVVPAGADSYREAIETVWDVRTAVRNRMLERGFRPLVADEGGFSPPLTSVDDAFELLSTAIGDAGHRPARDDVAFAVDVAASHFYDPDAEAYVLDSLDVTLDRDGMIGLVTDWADAHPLVSVEDPLAEDDWDGWQRLADRLPAGVQLLGDDLLVTDAERVERAVDTGAASSVLVKPNQTGTLTRAIEVVERAQKAGLNTVVSARSGETCDSTIADFAVALDAGQIKIGSLARSERLAKYNRLLEIDRDHGTLATPTFA